MVKVHLSMQVIQAQSLSQEVGLKKEMATHSSILPWFSMDRGAPRAIVHGIAKCQT